MSNFLVSITLELFMVIVPLKRKSTGEQKSALSTLPTTDHPED